MKPQSQKYELLPNLNCDKRLRSFFRYFHFAFPPFCELIAGKGAGFL
jgi:hypothetical protein